MSVNQMSGTVAFDVPLGSISTPSGLGAAVSISYTSHVAKDVTTWNREAPTETCGLGWKQDRTYILRQPLHTGFDDSDGYALVMGGSVANKLVLLKRTEKDATITRDYGCEPHQAWLVTRVTT